MSSELTKIFDEVRKSLDILDDNREKIMPMERQIIRSCSDIIKAIHRQDFKGIDTQLNDVKKLIIEVEKVSKVNSEELGKNYLTTSKQEYTEAAVLFDIASNRKVSSFMDLGVSAYEYVLGLADVVGELRRMILNCIRDNDFVKAEEIYGIMDELYELLFSLDYPSGLLPGLRNKVDNDRSIIGKTLEMITTSKTISQLNDNLEKNLKLQAKKTSSSK